MVKIETLKEDRFVRILRCRNRIWYQMWLTKEWLWVINKFQLYIEMGEIKVWWLRDLQQYYVFFYEKKGYKTIGVLGREITYKILGELL